MVRWRLIVVIGVYERVGVDVLGCTLVGKRLKVEVRGRRRTKIIAYGVRGYSWTVMIGVLES